MTNTKRIVLSIVAAATISWALYACSKNFVVADSTQRDNILQLENSWQYMENEYFSKDNVPPEFLRDSHAALLNATSERELGKRKTWEEQATEEGWAPADGSNDGAEGNQPQTRNDNTPEDNAGGSD